jgi:hypothetical protein
VLVTWTVLSIARTSRLDCYLATCLGLLVHGHPQGDILILGAEVYIYIYAI